MSSFTTSAAKWGLALLALAGPLARAEHPVRLVNDSDREWVLACFHHTVPLKITTQTAGGAAETREFPLPEHAIEVEIAKRVEGGRPQLAAALRRYHKYFDFEVVLPGRSSVVIESQLPAASGGAEFLLVDFLRRTPELKSSHPAQGRPECHMEYHVRELGGAGTGLKGVLLASRQVPAKVLAQTAASPEQVSLVADRWPTGQAGAYPGLQVKMQKEDFWLWEGKRRETQASAGRTPEETKAEIKQEIKEETPAEASAEIKEGGQEEAGIEAVPDQPRRFQITAMAHAGQPSGSLLAGQWLAVDQRGHRILLLGAGGKPQVWVGGEGRGETDGQGTQARFAGPAAIAVRQKPWQATLVDRFSHSVRQVDLQGNVTTLAGRPGLRGHEDGKALEATFDQPVGVAYGADGALYIADRGNDCIRRIQDGQVSTWSDGRSEAKDGDGSGPEARFTMLGSLVADPANGDLYVCDQHRIRRITGKGEVSTVAGPAGLCLPQGLSIEGGRLFIADSLNHRIQVLDLKAGDGRLTALDLGAVLEFPVQLAFDDLGQGLLSTGFGTSLLPLGPLAGAGGSDAKDTGTRSAGAGAS